METPLGDTAVNNKNWCLFLLLDRGRDGQPWKLEPAFRSTLLSVIMCGPLPGAVFLFPAPRLELHRVCVLCPETSF